jgi:small conductance mechanosensitive channel
MSSTTASEWLIHRFNAIFSHLYRLGPAELAVNLGLSAVVAAVAFGLIFGLERLFKNSAHRLPSSAVAKRVQASRAVRLGWLVIRAGMVLAAAWAVLLVWGFDPATWFTAGAGGVLMQGTLRLVLLIVLAVAAFEFTGFAINRLMGRIADAAREPRRAAQLRTLAPLLSAIARGTILILAAMMLLSELGVKIGPLLAGAGVVGVALGFGAQTLVKDFLTGLFFILEDIVSVGDSIRIGEFSGQVETMTLRTIRLRDFDGTLHVFPYGEAQVIHNATKSFSYAVIDLVVALDSDVDVALNAIRDAGETLARDPQFAPKLMAPMEVLGIEGMSQNGLRLKARIKTRPSQDAAVQRELIRRLKAAFDAKGVKIPSAQMRLVMPEGMPSPLAAAH